MKLNKNIIICEGPDHAGKTSLCNHLIEKYRFNYYHCGIQSDILHFHNDVFSMALSDVNNYNSNWIIDRLHLSEEVYGKVFRDGPKYDWKSFNSIIKQQCFESGIKFYIVLCLPPKDVVVNGHSKRNQNGDEMFSTVDKVYDLYQKLYDENEMYKFDFTQDKNYAMLDKMLENKNA